jgi:type I restriction enzyme, S subunit
VTELVKEPFELPKSWAWTSLGEIADVMDVDHKMPKPVKRGVLFISPKDFVGNYDIDFGNAKQISDEEYVRLSRKCKPELGDVIYSRIGTIGKVRKVPPEIRFQISYSLCLIRPREQLQKSNILYVFLQSPLILKQALDKRRSIGVPDLGLGDIKKFTLALPPLNEQCRIVGKVEELFSFLDAGTEALRKVQAQLKRYRQAVLKYAFEGKLTYEWRKTHKHQMEPAQVLVKKITEKRISNNSQWKNLEPINAADLPEIPPEWIWVRAQEVCENITNGYTPKASELHKREGEIPFIKINNLTFNGKLEFSKNSTFIDKQIHDKMLKRSKVFPGDVLINIVGPPLGKVSIVPNEYPEWNINQAIVFFRPIEGYNRDFLALCLQSETIISHLTNQAKATAGQFNVSVNMSRNLPIPFPPKEEQEKISFEIRKNFAAIESTEIAMNKSLMQADYLRNSILKSAFSGKLVPQDVSDEPAEMLLRRIKEQKSDRNKSYSRELISYVK